MHSIAVGKTACYAFYLLCTVACLGVKETKATFTMLCLKNFVCLAYVAETGKPHPSINQVITFFFGPEEEFWLAMNWASLCEYKI